MQLAFVLYKYFPYGGLQRDFLRIARICQARGHSVGGPGKVHKGAQVAGGDVRLADALADAGAEDQALLGHLLLKAGDIARQLGVGDAFRLVINNGADAGQTVFHLHIHLLANKKFAEGSLGL